MSQLAEAEFRSLNGEILLSNASLSLSIEARTGNWTNLTCKALDRDILHHGHKRVAIEVGVDRRWLPGPEGWQVEDIETSSDRVGVHCTLLLRSGKLLLRDSYTLRHDRPLLVRSARAVYSDTDCPTFWGMLFRLPAISLGAPEECLVLAPGQSTPSRLSFVQQAALPAKQPPLSDTKDRQGIGVTAYGHLDPAPDITPGIIGIHHHETSLMCWFYSNLATATVATEGHGDALAITHHHRVEGWAQTGDEFSCGSQYIALTQGSIEDALGGVRRMWAELGVVRPSDSRLTPGDTAIYETSARMEGGFARLAERLPGLRSLGIDTIYLLPIWLGTQVTADLLADDRALAYRLDPRWQSKRVPHRIVSHDIIDPAMGSAHDLRQMVDRAHSLGIRILFDLVFHGVAPESPLVQQHPDWFQRNLQGQMFPSHEWLPSYSLDWANPAVQDYFIGFALRNVREYDIDGYRIDAPFAKESNWGKGLPWRAGASGFGGVGYVERLRAEIKAAKPTAILLCEMAGPIWDTMCDLCNDDPFLRLCLKVAQADVQARAFQVWLADRLLAGVPGAVRILSIENHNSTRVNPSSLAYRGSPIAHALFSICCLAGGVPLIWSGQQHGQTALYRELLRLRRSLPALREGTTDLSHYADSPDVFVAIRQHHQQKVVVLANCGSRWDTVTVPLPAGIAHHRATPVWSSGRRPTCSLDHAAEGQALTCTVEPYAAYVIEVE